MSSLLRRMRKGIGNIAKNKIIKLPEMFCHRFTIAFSFIRSLALFLPLISHNLCENPMLQVYESEISKVSTVNNLIRIVFPVMLITHIFHYIIYHIIQNRHSHVRAPMRMSVPVHLCMCSKSLMI